MICVNSCGHDSHHKKPCNIEHKQGVPDYLFLLVKQDSWVYINNKKEHIAPNCAICFPKNTYIHYGCDTPGYNDDWIHFTLHEADVEILDRLQIPLYQVLHPHDFHKLSEYVKMLSAIFHNASTYKQEMIDSFMHILLYSLKDELDIRLDNPLLQKYYSEFATLRTDIYNNPAKARTIPQLADSLCLSLSYFQHLYKHFFGCSCRQDIIQARISLAKYYLTGSDISIKSLSDYCGDDNELHFMRQFKKFVGKTPSEYRNG